MTRNMTEGQREYEARRAAKAGVSLDKWLDMKRKQQEAEARERQKAEASAIPPVRKTGLLSRLLERAQKPL